MAVNDAGQVGSEGVEAKAFSGPVARFEAIDRGGPDRARRRTLLDDVAEAELERQGYTVVPFIPPSVAAHILEVYGSVGPAPDDPRSGFFAGNSSSSVAWKEEVASLVGPLVAGRLPEIFEDYHMYHLTFLVKWPGPDGALQAHQDPSMVEREGQMRGVTLWCPLSPSPDGDDGALHVVPGSHRLSYGGWYRGRGEVDSGLDAVAPAVYTGLGRRLAVAAGQSIVFDHRLVHFSPPNLTERPRVVLALALRPDEGAQHSHRARRKRASPMLPGR